MGRQLLYKLAGWWTHKCFLGAFSCTVISQGKNAEDTKSNSSGTM